MPLIDTATFVPDGGNYYTADPGTEFPEDLLNPGPDWDNIGHTDLDTPISPVSEGGERSILGTLQARQHRTRTSPRTDAFEIGIQQFNIEALRLYYGSNLVELNDGALVGVPSKPTPVEVAFLAVFVDGDKQFAFYAPRAEIQRAGDLELGSIEDLATLPISVTPLTMGANEYAYTVTPLGA